MPTMSSEYNQQYYEANKDKLKAKMKEKTHCEVCDKDIAKSNNTNHNKRKKHIEKMNKPLDAAFVYAELKKLREDIKNI
jgi:poly-D-alanine transfer protein DltD